MNPAESKENTNATAGNPPGQPRREQASHLLVGVRCQTEYNTGMTAEPTKPKPRRRWWQYSLRTFFVVLTVFGVWLGVVVHRANEQRKAVAWVREMGGSARYDYEFNELGIRVVDAKPSAPDLLVKLLGDDFFQEVSTVQLKKTQVSDLTPLTKFTSLEKLWLNSTHVSDLTPLKKLTSLRVLDLRYTQVSNLAPLADLKNLQILRLTITQVSDLTPLAKLTSLQDLGLSHTQVSDLTPLANLTSLDKLWLDNTQVSDLTPLAGLDRLRMLALYGTLATEEQVTELRQALPRCQIYWRPRFSDPSPSNPP